MYISWEHGCSQRLGHAKDYVRMQWMMLQQDAPGIMLLPPVSSLACDFVTWTAQELVFRSSFQAMGRTARNGCRCR